MQKQTTIVALIITIVVIAAGSAYYRQYQKGQDISNDAEVRTTVSQFGTTMQKVSLGAPDALQQIGIAYSPYVSEALINKWKSQKEFAPGRGLSSPWPDYIEIITVTKGNAGTYVVEGNVVEMTSTGIAGQYPVTFALKKQNNQWIIVDYAAGPYQAIGATTTRAQ